MIPVDLASVVVAYPPVDEARGPGERLRWALQALVLQATLPYRAQRA